MCSSPTPDFRVGHLLNLGGDKPTVNCQSVFFIKGLDPGRQLVIEVLGCEPPGRNIVSVMLLGYFLDPAGRCGEIDSEEFA